MSELNALNVRCYRSISIYKGTNFFAIPQTFRQENENYSLYMSVLERVCHELYYLIFTDGYLLFVPCSIRFCHVSNLLLLQ